MQRGHTTRDRRRGRQHPDRRGAHSLIISGRPEQAADLYYTFARLAKQMGRGAQGEAQVTRGESKDTSEVDYDYEYDEKHKTVAPTERGIAKAEEFLGVENLYLGSTERSSTT